MLAAGESFTDSVFLPASFCMRFIIRCSCSVMSVVSFVFCSGVKTCTISDPTRASLHRRVRSWSGIAARPVHGPWLRRNH